MCTVCEYVVNKTRAAIAWAGHCSDSCVGFGGQMFVRLKQRQNAGVKNEQCLLM